MATAIVALMLVNVQAQVAPAPSTLIVVDVAHASGDDRERLTRLARAIAPDAETRIWTGLRDDPVAQYRLSFAEAFDIFEATPACFRPSEPASAWMLFHPAAPTFR